MNPLITPQKFVPALILSMYLDALLITKQPKPIIKKFNKYDFKILKKFLYTALFVSTAYKHGKNEKDQKVSVLDCVEKDDYVFVSPEYKAENEKNPKVSVLDCIEKNDYRPFRNYKTFERKIETKSKFTQNQFYNVYKSLTDADWLFLSKLLYKSFWINMIDPVLYNVYVHSNARQLVVKNSENQVCGQLKPLQDSKRSFKVQCQWTQGETMYEIYVVPETDELSTEHFDIELRPKPVPILLDTLDCWFLDKDIKFVLNKQKQVVGTLHEEVNQAERNKTLDGLGGYEHNAGLYACIFPLTQEQKSWLLELNLSVFEPILTSNSFSFCGMA